MRRFDDPECDKNPNKEMAKVAARSCMHQCIQTVCGGDDKGKGCRFDFPKKQLPYTVPAIMQVNSSQMEARMLLRRTCTRVPNLNSYFLMYWRANHDVSVLIDAGHKLRYAVVSDDVASIALCCQMKTAEILRAPMMLHNLLNNLMILQTVLILMNSEICN